MCFQNTCSHQYQNADGSSEAASEANLQQPFYHVLLGLHLALHQKYKPPVDVLKIIHLFTLLALQFKENRHKMPKFLSSYKTICFLLTLKIKLWM